MKRIFLVLTVLLILLPVFMHFAQQNEKWTPVLMTRTELEKSITSIEARPLYKPGKIYVKDHLFFIVEAFKGIHVINNQNPAAPVQEGFITVPGVVDLAIRGTSLYVDNAVDLVAIEIGTFPEITVSKRIKNIFPEIVHPDWGYIPYAFDKNNRPENTIIVGWEKQ